MDVCFNSTVKCFRDVYGNYSDCVDCASVLNGYCQNGNCVEPVTPSWGQNETTLDIVQGIAEGVRNMLAYMGSPIFAILLVIGVTFLIIYIFGLVVTIAKKVGR